MSSPSSSGTDLPDIPTIETLKSDIQRYFQMEEQQERSGGGTVSDKKYFVKAPSKKDTAPCWKSFGKVMDQATHKMLEYDAGQDDEVKMTNFVVCLNRKCSAVYQYTPKGGTSAMMRHCCGSTNRAKSVTASPTSSTPDIRKMFTSANKALSTSEKERMTMALAMMCASDIRPFKSVSGQGFLSVIQTAMDIQARSNHKIDVQKLVAHPTTIARNIRLLATTKREILRGILSKLASEETWRGFTTDLWTDDVKKIAYISISVHYITNEWQMQACTLCVSPFGDMQHSAINVLNVFTETIQQFGCCDFQNCVVTTDNGSNMAGSAGLGSEFDRLPCADHKISTVLTTILSKTTTTNQGRSGTPFYRYHEQIGAITDLIDYSKSLVKYFKQTELQALLDKTLKQDNVTRWNSVLNMLVSIEQNYVEITNLLASKRQQHRVAAIYLPLLKELVQFLSTFQQATIELECSISPTIHLVSFWRYMLETKCAPITADFVFTDDDGEEKTQPKDSESILALKAIVRNVINQKWELELLHVVATLLDPRQSRRLAKYNVAVETSIRAKDKIRAMMLRYARLDTEKDHDEVTVLEEAEIKSGIERPAKRRRRLHGVRLSLDDVSDDSSIESNGSGQQDDNEKALQARVDNELTTYWHYRLPKSQSNDGYKVLVWWRNNKSVYPILSRVARSVLAIPASSAKSEGNFSDAGNTVTDQRNSLGPERVNDLLFVRSNHDLM